MKSIELSRQKHFVYFETVTTTTTTTTTVAMATSTMNTTRCLFYGDNQMLFTISQSHSIKLFRQQFKEFRFIVSLSFSILSLVEFLCFVFLFSSNSSKQKQKKKRTIFCFNERVSLVFLCVTYIFPLNANSYNYRTFRAGILIISFVFCFWFSIVRNFNFSTICIFIWPAFANQH